MFFNLFYLLCGNFIIVSPRTTVMADGIAVSFSTCFEVLLGVLPPHCWLCQSTRGWISWPRLSCCYWNRQKHKDGTVKCKQAKNLTKNLTEQDKIHKVKQEEIIQNLFVETQRRMAKNYEQKGSLSLRSDHMIYGRATLVSDW